MGWKRDAADWKTHADAMRFDPFRAVKEGRVSKSSLVSELLESGDGSPETDELICNSVGTSFGGELLRIIFSDTFD